MVVVSVRRGSDFPQLPDMAERGNDELVDIVLSDEEVEIAVEGLEMKYSHARSRKNPIANSDVVLACVDFVNRRDPKPITYCE